ncbi:hypothetical protein F5148DRAFT_891013 [Russula earlei]|uniref:Uncharacterized protein n=1 Tax=Russula earlei TaxID=71964 RepID=A0ACC0UA82_9AGAM|nr:hypothetical protein F5148DRAFT_891013 [Russula earlei]
MNPWQPQRDGDDHDCAPFLKKKTRQHSSTTVLSFSYPSSFPQCNGQLSRFTRRRSPSLYFFLASSAPAVFLPRMQLQVKTWPVTATTTTMMPPSSGASRWPRPPVIHANSRARRVPLPSPLLHLTHSQNAPFSRLSNPSHILAGNGGFRLTLHPSRVRGRSHGKRAHSPRFQIHRMVLASDGGFYLSLPHSQQQRDGHDHHHDHGMAVLAPQ